MVNQTWDAIRKGKCWQVSSDCMIAGKDNSGGVGNIFGTYEMTAEKQPVGCPGFYFEVELMPGAVVDSYSSFGICKWMDDTNTRY